MTSNISTPNRKRGRSLSLGECSQSSSSKSCRELFGDCALVEIIHLHDCLRGALKALQNDIDLLRMSVDRGIIDSKVSELERQVTGRFKVIWSVFQAHSSAEDEFIWPALQSKTGQCLGSPHHSESETDEGSESSLIEQFEYVEDHEDEERMFKEMDELLSKLRLKLSRTSSKCESQTPDCIESSVSFLVKKLFNLMTNLLEHLMEHLEKEETECMPLVVKHLNKEEINDVVGQIMGKRSSETIAKIMSMAVENLDEADREEMVRHMKQAMVGTFFEKWLSMSGWSISPSDGSTLAENAEMKDKHVGCQYKLGESQQEQTNKKARTIAAKMLSCCSKKSNEPITSKKDLERMIRSVVADRTLSPAEKNNTIQGLRDSVWKSNLQKRNAAQQLYLPNSFSGNSCTVLPSRPSGVSGQCCCTGNTRSKGNSPPSKYFKKCNDGAIDQTKENAPLFTKAEFAPTYHGSTGKVLGCPHYARSCKLRHPSSGRLYTCRLCCDQERENPLSEEDSNLDRYAVTEVYCMKCSTLQPANDSCTNPKCESQGSAFAKYHCKICNLYDDEPNKNIFHCPYCNVCKIGKGLGIDYRHCMQCNACVSLDDDDHRCIPQRLQSSCPICHESMFESTEPLRGLKCGHVMHLSCFGKYVRGGAYTCPLCKKSMEDMKEYFSMLDAAVRMQPMPVAYHATKSNISCQDCSKTSQVPYHFVGCKCLHCGSYNTRELGKVQVYTPQTPDQTLVNPLIRLPSVI